MCSRGAQETGRIVEGGTNVTLEQELKELVITGLGIKDIKIEDFDDQTPLFGEGIALDSLDALELVIRVHKKYGVKIENIDTHREALTSISSLATFIRVQQALHDS
jgi:acyl carrier protein